MSEDASNGKIIFVGISISASIYIILMLLWLTSGIDSGKWVIAFVGYGLGWALATGLVLCFVEDKMEQKEREVDE